MAVKVRDARHTDGCNACSFDSPSNRQNVKEIGCNYIKIFLCKSCRQNLIEKLKED